MVYVMAWCSHASVTYSRRKS